MSDHTNNIVETRMELGYSLLLDLAVPIQKGAHDCKRYDDYTMIKCRKVLGRDSVMLDIGANIGYFTCGIGSALATRNGRVYDLEPVPQNYSRLCENISLNDLGRIVAPQRLALGLRRGILKLFIEPEGSVNNAIGANITTRDDRRNISNRKWKSAWAWMTTLDRWVKKQRLTRCDLIKIDVEGAEMFVFKKGKRLLKELRPTLVAEFNPYWLAQAGFDFSDVQAFFSEFDYVIYREMEHDLQPLSDELIAKVGESMPTYFLLPRERETEIMNHITDTSLEFTGQMAV